MQLFCLPINVKGPRVIRLLAAPFHIGVPLGYLVLKKMEIQDLIVLIEAKSSGLPVEEFRPYLVSSEPPK